METKTNSNAREALIFTEEELKRIRKSKTKKGKMLVIVDLHGLQKKQAEKFIKNIIALNSEPFQMDIIHGYNHGTVLKDMVETEKISKRVKAKIHPKDNLGMTRLIVA